MWADLLGIERVGINDNFFDLGGHSLLATILVSRIHQAFQVELPMPAIFESPIVRDLAVVIGRHQTEQTKDEVTARLLTELDELSEEEAQRILADQM